MKIVVFLTEYAIVDRIIRPPEFLPPGFEFLTHVRGRDMLIL